MHAQRPPFFTEGSRRDGESVVRVAVASHEIVGEDDRRARRIGPVPIGNRDGLATHLAERVLEEQEEEPMPGREHRAAVRTHHLVADAARIQAQMPRDD